MLEGPQSEAFAAIYDELLGDAYTELGRVDDAEAAYQRVMLDPTAQATVNQQLVQWKALDLPEASVPDDAGAAEDAAMPEVEAADDTPVSEDAE